MIHWLKTDPPYFEEVWQGRKPFEVRYNDRNYQVDDILILAEKTEQSDKPRPANSSEKAVIARVISVLSSESFPLGLQEGYCTLGLHIIGKLYGDDVDLFQYHTTSVTSEDWKSRQTLKTSHPDTN